MCRNCKKNGLDAKNLSLKLWIAQISYHQIGYIGSLNLIYPSGNGIRKEIVFLHFEARVWKLSFKYACNENICLDLFSRKE